MNREIVCEFLDYDPETGKLTWKERDRKWFSSDKSYHWWNVMFAGKEAFTSLSKAGYYVGSILDRQYKAQRIIWLYMTGEWPEDEVDHIDHNKRNNRWVNLREASTKENGKNKSKLVTNTSGQTGVYWDQQTQKWRSFITVDEKKICLGRYDSYECAVEVRKMAEIQYDFHPNHGR